MSNINFNKEPMTNYQSRFLKDYVNYYNTSRLQVTNTNIPFPSKMLNIIVIIYLFCSLSKQHRYS